MICKAEVAVCSDIRTKHSTQSERHVEFVIIRPGGTEETARLLKVNTRYVSATMVPITYSSEKCLTFGVDFAKQKSAVKP